MSTTLCEHGNEEGRCNSCEREGRTAAARQRALLDCMKATQAELNGADAFRCTDRRLKALAEFIAAGGRLEP